MKPQLRKQPIPALRQWEPLPPLASAASAHMAEGEAAARHPLASLPNPQKCHFQLETMGIRAFPADHGHISTSMGPAGNLSESWRGWCHDPLMSQNRNGSIFYFLLGIRVKTSEEAQNSGKIQHEKFCSASGFDGVGCCFFFYFLPSRTAAQDKPLSRELHLLNYLPS